MEDLKIIQLYWEREESAIIQTKEKYGKTMEQLAYRLLFDYQIQKSAAAILTGTCGMRSHLIAPFISRHLSCGYVAAMQ